MIDFTKFILFDGGMGTMLQKRGLAVGELPELMNVRRPDILEEVHRAYVLAGSQVASANTFGANGLKYSSRVTGEKAGMPSVSDVVTAGVQAARRSGAQWTALDMGPTGAMLQPLGQLSFDRAYELYREQVEAGAAAGADLIIIETMMDLLETKAAVLAAKENSRLPVIASMTYAADGRTFLGTDPKTAVLTLCGLGVDAVGCNCSLGPAELLPIVEEILQYASVPVICQANAGLPVIENGETVYKIGPQEYAACVEQMIDAGVSIVGGCCGTTPEYIAALRRILDEKKMPCQRQLRRYTAITSGMRTVLLDGGTAVIGERINPTGKKKLQAALREKNYAYIMGEAISQTEAGADILDVNAGLPEIDEAAVLTDLVREIQGVTPLPLQIDSADPEALEAAVRRYNGKPIINSVNGKRESLAAILPIAAKYGAAVVGLTLDENGIPETAEGRFAIAQRILDEALAYGIPKEDVLIDTLTLTASSCQAQVTATLDAIKLVKSRLGLKTVLGVSNVSFGLPAREIVNSTFLAAAFGAGLDMPILNPMSAEYQKIVSVFKVLNNEDKGSAAFIEAYADYTPAAAGATAGRTNRGSEAGAPAGAADACSTPEALKNCILTGRKAEAGALTKELLAQKQALEIINDVYIPALDEVGRRFENGSMFLPQLMAAAEAVQEGFTLIKEKAMSVAEGSSAGIGPVVVATVKGDIHDIGKNIVKMLMENYGLQVIDLGRDVPPETVVAAVKEHGVRLVALSALMTTTVRSMKETIEQLRAAEPDCRIMVGGAVLNEAYADMVGADYYTKDAASAAKTARGFFEE